jgi:hypothetical protein
MIEWMCVNEHRGAAGVALAPLSGPQAVALEDPARGYRARGYRARAERIR